MAGPCCPRGNWEALSEAVTEIAADHSSHEASKRRAVTMENELAAGWFSRNDPN